MLDNIFYMNLSQGSSPCCEGDWLAERRKALVMPEEVQSRSPHELRWHVVDFPRKIERKQGGGDDARPRPCVCVRAACSAWEMLLLTLCSERSREDSYRSCEQD